MSETREEVVGRTAERRAAGVAIGMPGADRKGRSGGTPERKPLVVLTCLHRGLPTGETMPYGGCCGGKASEAAVHACALYGRCTVERLFSGVSCCRDCDDRTAQVPDSGT